MTLVAHPDKEELIMFGGECYTGKQVSLLNTTISITVRPQEIIHCVSVNWYLVVFVVVFTHYPIASTKSRFSNQHLCASVLP